MWHSFSNDAQNALIKVKSIKLLYPQVQSTVKRLPVLVMWKFNCVLSYILW